LKERKEEDSSTDGQLKSKEPALEERKKETPITSGQSESKQPDSEEHKQVEGSIAGDKAQEDIPKASTSRHRHMPHFHMPHSHPKEHIEHIMERLKLFYEKHHKVHSKK
jgi:hypothetical protein